MSQVFVTIPYPPTVNHYWGFHGHRRFLTSKANQFKAEVAHQVSLQSLRSLGSERLEVSITLFPPDKRMRDIDNVIKSTLDALCQSGLFEDDSQVDVLLILRGEVVKGGKAEVIVTTITKDLNPM